jgi:Icc-related predicted phosphoesterase
MSPEPAVISCPPTPQRPLLLGDTHADWAGLKAAIAHAVEIGADAIVSVGDLGFWPRDGNGQRLLTHLRKALTKAGLDLYFVEGNHDDLAVLFFGAHPQAGPFRQVAAPMRHALRGGVYHIPRGTRWTWNGVRFLGVGGGWSIDQDYTTEGVDWFPQETISQEEKDAILADGGQVDVVIAHDCPAGLLILNAMEKFPNSTLNGERLAAICAQAEPLLVVHGHYHVFHDTEQHDPGRNLHTRVLGLDCMHADELDSRTCHLLDLHELAVAAPALRAARYRPLP